MKGITFTHKHACVSSAQLQKTLTKLRPEIQRIKKDHSYETGYASLSLPHDKKMIADVLALARKKRHLHPELIVVVGIGGSNLGTIAVQEAILGKYHNQVHPDVKVLYADTVDSDEIAQYCAIVTSILQRHGTVLVIGVSKSGGTTETIANFEIFVNLLKKHKKNWKELVTVISDRHSRYWEFGKREGFSVLDIPKLVGGRYSVFSPVGLFPLALLGVNIKQLLTGAHSAVHKCLKPKNPAAISAALQYLHHKKGAAISDTFLFATDLESIGRWYRQLMGESIGKEFNVCKKRVFEGITPTVSVGSTDLHSMAQLYLGGPYDKFTTFIRVKEVKNKLKVPDLKKYDTLVPHIQGKPLTVLMDAILDGVQTAFAKGKRPFVEIALPKVNEYTIGQLLQFKMIEMMYLGFLLGVNPFNQPNVEAYKIETKKILRR